MKNYLSNPKKVSVFHRYAPLLQGGWGKSIMLSFIVLLCAFTMSKFAAVNLQGLQDFVSKETLDIIGMTFGALFGAATITHFAATFLIVSRDGISLVKKQEGVNKPIFLLNVLTCLLIMAFDGYVSLVGIKDAVADMGANLAQSRYTTETQQADNGYTNETSKDWQAWRTDSANITALYNNKIAALTSKSKSEIGDLKGKAARGAAAGSTTWAASLQGQARGKEAQLAAKIGQIEADKAQALLDRASARDQDVRQKSSEKTNRVNVFLDNKNATESKYQGYASKTWIFSLALYILYMISVVKNELIHNESGIENETEVQESYFRVSFSQNLKHELGEWTHDVGRIVTNKLAEWRKGLRQKGVFQNLLLDAGDAYRQQVNFSAPLVTAMANEDEMAELYKQTGRIGFLNQQEKAPTLPDLKQEEILENGKIRLTAYFDTVPPFRMEFDNKAQAESWKRHIHPDVPMKEKLLSTNLRSELAQMKTQAEPPRTPPPPPVITEISAPCENVITNSDLRVRKENVITRKEAVITNNVPVITAEALEKMPKAVLSYTLSGIKKMESEVKSRAKRGEITAATYEKKMRRAGEGRRLIAEATGQTRIQFV